MPKYYLRAGDYELDYKRMSATVEKRAHQKMRQAARIFLRTVIDIIPVWTGEAMGSLAPIAHYLHVAIPSTPNINAPYDGFALGASQSYTTSPFIKRENWHFYFEIGSSVPHFNINEYHKVTKWGIRLTNPTPWRAFQAGKKAATEFLQRTGKDIVPNFANFIIMKNVMRYG